jgi:hypothetical protein
MVLVRSVPADLHERSLFILHWCVVLPWAHILPHHKRSSVLPICPIFQLFTSTDIVATHGTRFMSGTASLTLCLTLNSLDNAELSMTSMMVVSIYIFMKNL